MNGSLPDSGTDRRRTLAVAEDAQRIEDLAQELQRNALELGGQSQKLRGTLEALEAATEELDRRTAEAALAQTIADAATARLARLQSITAALSNTVTQDGVAESVLREAIVALECEAGAVVVSVGEESERLELLREAGSLDPIMRSFTHAHSPESRGPYSDAVENAGPIYLESLEEMRARYPSFGEAREVESHGAWIFLPLEIGGTAVGALAFGFARPRRFTLQDTHFAETVSRYCAQALDRVRLRDAAESALAVAREARMMAEHANSAKTLFLRSISHELRTPLHAIAGFTEVLELGIRGAVNAEQSKDLARIKTSSRMRDIICQSTFSSAALAASESAARLRQRARASLVFIACGSCFRRVWAAFSRLETKRTYHQPEARSIVAQRPTRNGLRFFSRPIVVSGPCPQMTRVASSSASRRVLIEASSCS